MTRETRDLVAYFSLTFLLSWSLFTASTAISNGAVSTAVLILGVFVPSFVALVLSAISGGREGVRALLGRIFREPVAARWYLFAAGFIAAIKLAVAVLYRVITATWPTFGDTPWYVMIGAIVLSTPVQAGEEVGWRGYALPRLSERLGLGPASLLLGVVWAFWHLPFFFTTGADKFGQSFPLYLTQVTGVSVAMAWLFWKTGGSLLPVMLFHAAINNTKDIVPSAVPGAKSPFALSTSLVAWLTVALLWICAAYFLRQMRGVRAIGDGGRSDDA